MNLSPRRKKALDTPELGLALQNAFRLYPATHFTLDLDALTLRWQDGPTPLALWRAASDPPGWQLEVRPMFADFSQSTKPRVVQAEHVHSRLHLAHVLVRFYGKKTRLPDLARASDQEAIEALLAVLDDEEVSRYSIVDAIAREIVSATNSATSSASGYLGDAITTLREIGYDAMWARAFGEIR